MATTTESLDQLTGPLGTMKMFIGGEWVDSLDGASDEVTTPRDGSVVGHVPRGERADAQRAIAAANDSEKALRELTVFERSKPCLRIADAIDARTDHLARVISLDQGKPYHSEGRWEAGAFSHFFRQAAEDIVRLNGESIPSSDRNKRVITFHRPRGTYAVVTPWNFPYNIPSEYISAALACGNPVVWVPAPSTSACAVAYAECLEEADLPPGAFNLVTGAGPVVGDEIVASAGTRGVAFTGSPQTGETIAQRAAGKPLLLELGGNGPVIVLDDADLDAAVQGIVFSAFFNAGQACSATERVLVHRSIHDELAERLVAAATDVRLGDPFDPDTTMGPLNNEQVAAKMDAHIEDAESRGANVLAGGGRADGMLGDLYYRPTVLSQVSSTMRVNREESFGPIIPVIAFDDAAEAIELANDNELGLISSVYTRSLRRAFFFGENVQTGIVNINETPDYWESHIPYGGASGKRSGIGRLGGANTLREMSEVRSMIIDLGSETDG
jgi:succinate-semialdehyde dehydrogenase/glutarate-semialdehyde dehydrogenase